MVIHERMEYGIVQIINLHRPTQERLREDSKLEASKRQIPKAGNSINGSADQTQTLQH